MPSRESSNRSMSGRTRTPSGAKPGTAAAHFHVSRSPPIASSSPPDARCPRSSTLQPTRGKPA
eukprot:16450694-Heterocapsa_arctica.AAC.1